MHPGQMTSLPRRLAADMAGGVLKGFGATAMVLGGILLLAALGGAGFGFYMLNEQQERGLFADEGAESEAEFVLLVSAVAAGVGVLLLILGGILLAVGGSVARRELLRAVAAGASQGGAPVAPPASRTGWVVASVLGGILLVAVVAVAYFESLDVPAAFGGPGQTEGDTVTEVLNETFQGRVQGAGAPVVGGANAPTSQFIHEASLAAGAYVLTASLDWTESAAGASSMTVYIEVAVGGEWKTVAEASGPPGTVATSPGVMIEGEVRLRVFADDAGPVDQAYTATLVAVSA